MNRQTSNNNLTIIINKRLLGNSLTFFENNFFCAASTSTAFNENVSSQRKAKTLKARSSCECGRTGDLHSCEVHTRPAELKSHFDIIVFIRVCAITWPREIMRSCCEWNVIASFSSIQSVSGPTCMLDKKEFYAFSLFTFRFLFFFSSSRLISFNFDIHLEGQREQQQNRLGNEILRFHGD